MKNFLIELYSIIGTLTNSYVIKAFIAINLILTPIKPIALVVFCLIFGDLIAGIYRSWKMKEKITSKRMSNTGSKILLYNLCILSMFILETFVLDFFPEKLYMTKFVAGFLGLTELKSIFENTDKVLKINILKKFMEFLKRPAEEIRDVLSDEEEDNKTSQEPKQ